ncbi:alpha/beta hydrolase-fold protein [Saccharicrinis sp. 156]|uniref:alpha/beta hydrolase-fold protein n=1 Tax=Saccharicrinis sp. 156 TaxID=3417574 RepID=UPI003D331A68
MLKFKLLLCVLTFMILHNSFAQDTISLKKGLVVGAVDISSRSVVNTDPVFYQLITNNDFKPQLNDSVGVNRHGDTERWDTISANAEGLFKTPKLRGGYLFQTYNSPEECIRILEISGHREVFVNGSPRGGDIYNKHLTFHPVQLKKGKNTFLVKGSRGQVKIQLLPVEKNISFMQRDLTTPDFITTEDNEKVGAVRILNASSQTQKSLKIVAESNGIKTETNVSTIVPLTMRKVAYWVKDAYTRKDTVDVNLKLYDGNELLDETTVRYKVRAKDQFYVRTFISDMDGSVQYFAVRESNVDTLTNPAMFLSLHGAAVEARGQSAAYQPKEWGHIICPTNRRDYGFDWEDWGRWDAMEVQKIAENMYGTDPEKTYLTGHSMGGHGTWQIGATFPGKWAALSPMSGWYSFFSYSNKEKLEEPDPLQKMFERASHSSHTLELSRNYLHHGIYIQHGDSDHVVPVGQARFMREHLSAFHPDFAYYEHPGRKHWFGIDFPMIFDYFKWHSIPENEKVKTFEFRTASPGVSASSRFITLYQQDKPFEFCGVKVSQRIPTEKEIKQGIVLKTRWIDIETENLSKFKLDITHCAPSDTVEIRIDQTSFEHAVADVGEVVWFEKENDNWRIRQAPTNTFEKNPVRYGNFKDGFRNNMIFVYSTKGTEAENKWSFNKARFDAETFYYRGNGSIDIISDKEFKASKYKDRSVILYGNASTNAAWKTLLKDCPVQVKNGEVIVGDKLLKGNSLSAYFIYPRMDSEKASVVAISGTGMEGFKAASPNRYFVSGVGIPDLMVFTPSLYNKGIKGVKAAGYFGNDWSVEKGDIVWK